MAEPTNGKNTPPEFTLLTPRQTAAALSISTRKLWEETDQERIRAVRIGRLVRYDTRDIEAYIERCKSGAAR